MLHLEVPSAEAMSESIDATSDIDQAAESSPKP